MYKRELREKARELLDIKEKLDKFLNDQLKKE